MLFLESNAFQLILWLLLVPLVLIAILIIVAVIVRIQKQGKVNSARKQKIVTEAIDYEQQLVFYRAFGGKENMLQIEQNLSRISVQVEDVNKVDAMLLKELGANGVLISDHMVKCSFGDRAEYIYQLLK
ncbi:MAG: hypothetical protein PHP41_00180 [Bacilli bacterium]|nr:hypothetical protein [Bacilli bacterium]MDY0064223.1 hypothetical protein [Bacilli bacterium]